MYNATILVNKKLSNNTITTKQKNCKKFVYTNSILAVFIQIIFISNSFAQIEIPDSILNIPPLGDAINMALEHSPLLKSSDIETSIRKFQLKSVRREWLDNMGIESFYKYGSIDNVNIQNIGSADQITNAQTTDTRYSIGVYLKMSFFSFINQGTKNKIALQEIKKSKYHQEFIRNEIRKAVIKQYQEYLYNKKLISIKNKAYIATQMQVEKANIDYENGNLNLYEMTKVMESATKAETEYFKAISDFKISYLLLLELIGANHYEQEQNDNN
jgi:outer membrane protein TolC